MDHDEPITTNDRVAMTKAFSAKYGFTVPANDSPSDSLLGQCFRQSKAKSNTFVDLSKVRTLAEIQGQTQTSKRKLGGGVSMVVTNVEMERPISDEHDYLSRIDTLMFAYSYTGLTETTSAPQGVWFSYQCALNYSSLMRRGVRTVGLPAATATDMMIRKGLVEKVRNEGMSLGAALNMMAKQYEHLLLFNAFSTYLTPPATPRTPPTRSLVGGPAAKVAPKVKAKAKAKTRAQRDGGPDTGRMTCRMSKNGQVLCKPWNDRRGCRGACNKRHACDLDLGGGNVCDNPGHTRMQHPQNEGQQLE
jgi:hypothetical protein